MLFVYKQKCCLCIKEQLLQQNAKSSRNARIWVYSNYCENIVTNTWELTINIRL